MPIDGRCMQGRNRWAAAGTGTTGVSSGTTVAAKYGDTTKLKTSIQPRKEQHTAPRAQWDCRADFKIHSLFFLLRSTPSS
jgi:hypothetical protein